MSVPEYKDINAIQDLEDLGIPCSFTVIQSKSKEAFKKLVKTKAHELTL